jgi:hypothetical protein
MLNLVAKDRDESALTRRNAMKHAGHIALDANCGLNTSEFLGFSTSVNGTQAAPSCYSIKKRVSK